MFQIFHCWVLSSPSHDAIGITFEPLDPVHTRTPTVCSWQCISLLIKCHLFKCVNLVLQAFLHTHFHYFKLWIAHLPRVTLLLGQWFPVSSALPPIWKSEFACCPALLVVWKEWWLLPPGNSADRYLIFFPNHLFIDIDRSRSFFFF